MKRHTSIVLLFLLLTIQGSSQMYNPKERGNYFVTNYERSFLEGSAVNWSIYQDKIGVVYIGNGNGILTYDGQKVRKILNENGSTTTGLTRSIFADSKNNIYTILGGKFGFIEKNNFGDDVFIPLSDKLAKKDEVKTTLWSAGVINDTAVFQSENSVYIYKYKKLIKVQTFDDVLHTININKNGAFLRIWGKGLYKFINGEFKLIPATASLFSNNRIDEQYDLSSGDNLLVSRNIGLWLLRKDGMITKANSPLIDQFVKENESYQGGGKLKTI